MLQLTHVPFSDATKDRFIALYHVTDKASVRSRELFNATVLELVKVIQASLAIFGMFEFTNERNGLLCDTTCDGIQRWVTEFGEPHLHIEARFVHVGVCGDADESGFSLQPTEKVADPTVIAALFSIILSTRSKLHALSYVCNFLSIPPRALSTSSGGPEGPVPRPLWIRQSASNSSAL